MNKLPPTVPAGVVFFLIGLGMALVPPAMQLIVPTAYAWATGAVIALGTMLVSFSVPHIITVLLGIVALIAFLVCLWNALAPLFEIVQ